MNCLNEQYTQLIIKIVKEVEELPVKIIGRVTEVRGKL